MLKYTLRTLLASGYIRGMKRSETLTIRLTPEAKAELLRLARADKRPPAQLAAIIIEAWLEREAKSSPENERSSQGPKPPKK